MISELIKKDPKPSDAIISWLHRLQELYYCDMDGMKDRTCHCTGWDYDHPLYRFYLCPHARPKWHLAYKELFQNGRRKDSREDTRRLP